MDGWVDGWVQSVRCVGVSAEARPRCTGRWAAWCRQGCWALAAPGLNNGSLRPVSRISTQLLPSTATPVVQKGSVNDIAGTASCSSFPEPLLHSGSCCRWAVWCWPVGCCCCCPCLHGCDIEQRSLTPQGALSCSSADVIAAAPVSNPASRLVQMCCTQSGIASWWATGQSARWAALLLAVHARLCRLCGNEVAG